MLSYVIAAGKGKRVPPPVIRALDLEEPSELFFQPDERLRWRNEQDTVRFFGWQAATETGGIRSHWHRHEGCLTAFSGHVWPRDGWMPGRGWAAQLAAFLERGGAERALEDCFGSYTLASLGREGGFVSSDPFGGCPLYYAETDESFVVSNRAALTARVIDGGRSVSGVGWLPYFAYIVGHETGFVGVTTLGPDECIRIGPGGRVTRGLRDSLWKVEGLEVDFDAVLADLVANVRGSAALETPAKILRLSGGKDSRLVLALILAAGVGDEFSLVTVGLPEAPDVVIARMVAARSGLEHEVQPPVEEVLDPAGFEERVRVHVFQTSGMLGAFTLRGGLGSSQNLALSGFFGELMRSHYAARHSTPTVPELEAFFDNVLRFDDGGLLREEARASYRESIRAWIAGRLAEGVIPADIPDVFYLQNRIPRWFGTAQELNGRNPQGAPLQSLHATRTAFLLGAHARKIDRLHFELLRRASEPLAKLPLANASWHPDTYAHLPDAAEYAALEPYRRERRVASRWQEVKWQTNLPVVADYLGSSTNPIYDVLDRGRVLEALEGRRPLSIHGKEQLYGALTAAIWLDHREKEARIALPTTHPNPPELASVT